jgi:peptidylamidoglycolate lyase
MYRWAWICAVFVAALGLSARSGVAAEVPDEYRVVHGWPQLPDGFLLGDVSGVAVDSHNHVFVFHRGVHPVLSFDGDTGKLIGAWGDDLFVEPHGLAVDRQDNVWVTDDLGHQVFKFSNDGKLLMTLGARKVPGEDENHFNGPTRVAIAPNGEFYVSDGYGNSRIAKFSPEGQFLFAWGKKGDQAGEFNTPHGLSLDALGRVYVADRDNARVQIFDKDGKFVAQWKGAKLGRPWDVIIGPDGYAYVVDGGQDDITKPPDEAKVLKLDLQGHILTSWGRVGNYDGQFCFAHSIAIARDGDVYVTDVMLGRRVQKFVRTHGK